MFNLKTYSLIAFLFIINCTFISGTAAHNKVVVIPLGGEDSPPPPNAERNGDNNEAFRADPNYLVISTNTISGEISPSLDVDWYEIYNDKLCQTITIETKPRNGVPCGPFVDDNSTSIDTQIALYTNARKEVLIASNDDISSSNNYCSRISTIIAATGFYYLEVDASREFCDTCTFPYTVEISFEDALC